VSAPSKRISRACASFRSHVHGPVRTVAPASPLNTQSLIYRPWIKLKLEALRTLFLEDLLARPLEKSEKPGGLWDREGGTRVVFEIDGTREAALQSLLPIPS
jgi:hypothetical protein